MAALLVGLSVMAILMGAAMPVWSKQAQREREEEYLFRAREYARGVMKWQHKYGASFPPSLDVLVEQRFVRRKYKDPLSGQDFNPVFQTAGPIGQPGVGSAGGSATPGQIPQGQTQSVGGFGYSAGGTGGFGSGTSTSGTGAGGAFGGGTATLGQTGGTSSQSQQGATPGAPVIGVVSKSKASSIKVYNGRTRYDQWAVTYQDIKPGKGLPPDVLQAMNAAGAAAQQQGGFGAPGQGGAANPFGAKPGTGQPGANPFGQPGTNPFGGAQPGAPGGNPFGQPGTNPFGGAGQKPAAPGASPFQPAYPPPATTSGQNIFGQPQKKQ
jgi:type II secretory pathway pseudopilin PulG